MQTHHRKPRSVTRARSAAVTGLRRGGRRLLGGRSASMVHLFGAIAMLLGLLTPILSPDSTLAAPQDNVPEFQTVSQNAIPAGVTQVVAFGDFQSQVGCGDWDPNCSASGLTNTGGIWSGNFGLAPGSYQVQFAVMDQNGNQFIFGSGGQDGSPISFSVGDGQLGAFFQYNAHTNETQAQGLDALYTVQTDLGTFIPTPAGGTLDVLVESQGGSTNVQLIANGEPVGGPQSASLSPGWTRISLDTAGNVVNSQGLTYGTLTVQRLDADGNPAGGGCYQLIGGGLVNQACADGNGNATMTFPLGLNPGSYTLVEVQAPAGQEAMPDQNVDLQPGDQTVTLQPEGVASSDDGDDSADDAGDDGTADSGDDGAQDGNDGTADDGDGDNGGITRSAGFPSAMVVTIQDSDGNPVPGACWQLIQDGNVVQESCDSAEFGDTNPDNGRTAFDSVEPGDYTLHQSSGPEGMELADDQQVTISGDGSNVDAFAEVPAAAQPETPEAATGDVVVLRADDQGNAIGGACFEIRDDSQNVIAAQVCDEDGDVADDGRTGFTGVPEGTWWVVETRTPDGVEPADPVQFSVNPNASVDVPVQSAAIQVETPTEEPTDQPTEEPTDEATEEPTDATTDIGNLQIDLYNPDGDLVGGACWQLIQDGQTVIESCDTDNGQDRFPFNGKVGLYEVPVGTYTLHMSQVPDGYQAYPDETIDIAAGDALRELTVQPADDQLPTEEPTDAATEEPTEEPTEPTSEPTEEGSGGELGEPGSLVVTLNDSDGNPIGGACFELVNGQDVIAESCDQPGSDDFPNNGRTGFFGVPSGTFLLRQVGTVDGFQPVQQDGVVIEPNQQTDVTLTAESDGSAETPTEEPAQPTEEPTEVIPGETTGLLVDASGVDLQGQQLCVRLETTGGIGMSNPPAACDNDENDGDDRDGFILLQDVMPGTYAFVVTSGPDELVLTQWPNVTVDDGQVTDLPLQSEPEPTPEPEPGTLRVTITDAEGTTIEQDGTCLTVDGATGSICDNQDGDAEPNAGEIEVQDIPAGTYDVVLDEVPEGFTAQDGPSGVDIAEGETTDETVALQAELGQFQVVAVNENGQPVGGACWELLSGDSVAASQCDDDSNGGTANDGFATFADVTPGDYTLHLASPPTGFQAVDDQPVTIGAGDNDPLQVTLAAEPGSLRAVVTADGEALADTCVSVDGATAVCDNQDGDADPTEGVIQVDGIAPGAHIATLSGFPDGYTLTNDAPFEVTSGEVSQVDFALVAQTGSLRAAISGEDGPVGGTCLDIADVGTVCDNQDGDADPEIGSIQVDGLTPGDYTVQLSNLPDGVETPASQTASVTANEVADVTFDLVETPPATADLRVLVQTADAEPVAGGCVELVQGDTVMVGPICDNGAGDADSTDGVILLQGVDVGSYTARLTAESTAAIPGYQSSDEPSVTVAEGADNQGVITVSIESAPANGSLEIITRNNATNERVGGACYMLGGPATELTFCDNDASDLNGQPGVIQLVDIPAGEYTLSMTTTPEGFNTAIERSATVEANGDASYEVRLDPLPDDATLTVFKVDPDDEPLGNSCFALRQGGTTIASRCDSTDSNPNDGTLVFEDVPAGTYLLVETRSPSTGYGPASPVSVTIVAGVDKEVTVVNHPKPGRVVVTKVNADDATEILPGACFSLEGDRTYGPFCDSDDGSTDGRIVFPNVAPGDYTLVETSPPPGFVAADDRDVTVAPGGVRNITVANERAPLPEETGTLVVSKVDTDGDPLSGSCFRLYDGNAAISGQVCDGSDGANDGTITFEDVPVGTWTLRETVTPSTDYEFADLVDVTIENNKTTNVDIENVLKRGRLQVNKTNTDGSPLQNACFDLVEDDGGARCTDAYGIVVFSGLEPGLYTLVETQAPYGYEPSANIADIQVRPGQTRVVNVVNERTPPPANTGSVQVQKFFCPAGERGERTEFFGGAQGSQQLARTAGCERGDAVFTLTGDDGTGGPGEFRTGSDGQFQTTVTEGIYRLTETNPDLEGNSTVRVRVNRGQMTTVIVINYLAPPEPDPIKVDVSKYTCTPSFNGTRYEDFAEGCSNDQQLTNTITIRLQGPVTTKAVTGDGGQRGRTSFEGLTPGTYTIFEDRPYGIPTDYLFCGTDPNNPGEFKAVNGSVTVKLNYGQTLTCSFHNIPEVLTEDTGTILVRKFVCEVASPPKGYDWEQECGLSHQNMSFSLAQYDAESQTYGEPVVVQANPDGFVRFTHLEPGSYQLREVDGAWCHAESNSVNASGDVVVRANTLSEVWIYNCVEPQTPPNTGSGDAATNPPPVTLPTDGSTDAPVALPMVSLPLLAAGAWFSQRRRAA